MAKSTDSVAESARVSPVATCFFTRQLSIMLASGVPLVQALETLTDQPDEEWLGEVVRGLCESVSGGHTFSNSLRAYPKVFSKAYATLVQAGEETGKLENSLNRLADWLERDEQIRRKVKSSLSYPVLVLGLCGLLSLIIVHTVLPTFVTIFQEMNTALPLITRVMILLTKVLNNPFAWSVGLLLACAGGYQYRRFVASRRGAVLVYRTALAIPLVGAILRQGASARYCTAASTLLACGMNLPRSLRLAAAASGNPLMNEDADALVRSVEQGLNPSEHMLLYPEIYSRCMRHMLSAGEESGQAAEMFRFAGDYHQLEMESAVELLGAALEPILLLGVSIVVGLMLLAIFLPLYSSLSNFG